MSSNTTITAQALSALPNAAQLVQTYKRAKQDGGIVSQALAAAIETAAPQFQKAVTDGALTPEDVSELWLELASKFDELAMEP